MDEILTEIIAPKTADLCGLLQILEATATKHAVRCSCGQEEMLSRYQCVWMIARSWVRLFRPLPTIPLEVKTWTRPIKHGISRREFDVYAQGERIAEAVEAWILVDVKTRRIRSMDTMPELLQFPAQQNGKTVRLRRPAMPDTPEYFGQTSVKQADIDCNGHLNNAKYPDYALAMLPSRPVKQLEISYCHECFSGDVLQIYGKDSGAAAWLEGRVDGRVCFVMQVDFFQKHACIQNLP